jgi:hypothetical protein
MSAHGAVQDEHTESASELYIAFELGEKSWKLSLGDGARGPSRYTVTAGDTSAVLECIVKTRARCGLALETRVHSCYEAGRDGFWLHRWLIAQGIDNLVVDSASIEVNRRARRAKTDRLDSDKLLGMLMRYIQPANAACGRWCGYPRRSRKTRGERTGNWGGWGKSAPATSIGFVGYSFCRTCG